MIQPPECDRAVGMAFYATGSPPCRARLRVRPGEFAVEEVLEFTTGSGPPNDIPLYRVEKRGIDTPHVERELAAALKSRVAYAGLKDKRATAVQYMTPTSRRAARPQRVDGERFVATLVGYLPRPLSRSMVSGNRFRVVLRECCSEIGERIARVSEAAAARLVPNFYGLQRFGTRDPITHRVGRAIVRRKFDEAVSILISEPRGADDEPTLEARRLLSQGRFREGLRALPEEQDIEILVARSLAKKPGDLPGALRSVPITVRRLFVQAFQSYLFNRTLSVAFERGIELSRPVAGDNWGTLDGLGLNVVKVHGVKEPMVGSPVPLVQLAGYAYRNYGSRFDECLESVMSDEAVQPRDFFVQDMQEVSVEGGFRRPHLAVLGLKDEESGDARVMEFTLPRGGYATVLLRELLKPADPFGSGFA